MKTLFIFLSLFTLPAFADDVVTWKHPTLYTDGTTLDLADIDRTLIRWYNAADTSVMLGSVEVTAPAITTTIPRDTMIVGTWCYQAATIMKTTAGGRQSNFAPVDGVCKTISTPTGKKPKAPTNLVTQ